MTKKTLVAVGEFDKKVVVKFDHPILMLELDANNALDVSEEIAKVALQINSGMRPSNALKVSLAEKAAKILIPRVELMLKSLRDKPNAYKANQIVATCLSEVL